ncbi:MAG: DUF192 domain-containing protein [Patescibacteria group bacterium]
MKWLFIFGVIALFTCAVLFLWLRYGRPGPLRGMEVKIDSATIAVEVADTILSRERGLSGRDGLLKNHGMLFIFPIVTEQGFWMKDMRFPLDMVWIKGDRVVGVTEQVYPEPDKPFWKLPIYKPPEAVDRVLEVTAGTATLHGWKKGSVVQFLSSEVK